MAALNFPNSPSTNDLHTENGLTFKWNGTIWKKVGPAYTDTTNLNVTGIGTIAGNFHVGGVLTYEDVKNVDSVGIVTARTAVHVGAGISAVGIITGTSFRGDGSQLTGITQVGGATTVGFDDNKPIYFGSQDDYKMYWNGTRMYLEPTSSSTTQILEIKSNDQMYINSKDQGLFLMSGNQNVIDIYGGVGGGVYFKHNNSQKLKLEGGNWTYLNGATVTHAGDVFIPDKIVHTGDTNTAIRFPSADTFSVETAGSERVRITSAGYMGINTNSPVRPLHIVGNDGSSGATSGNSDTTLVLENAGTNGSMIEFMNANNGAGHLMFTDSDASNRGRISYHHNGDYFRVDTAGSERLRIDSSGRLLVGHTSTVDTSTYNSKIQVMATDATASITVGRFGDNASSTSINFSKSRAASIGSHSSGDLHNNDPIGSIFWWGSDGGDYEEAARITAEADAAFTTSSTPGALTFHTTAPNATTATEVLRITSGGHLYHTGGGNGRRYSFASDGSSHYMKHDTTLNGIILNGYGGIAFETNGTNERLRITSAGKVDIGSGGNYGSNPRTVNIGSRAQNIMGSLAIARGEAIGGGTGPLMEFVHGPDGGTQRIHQIYSYIGDLRIVADSNENMDFLTGGSQSLRINNLGRVMFGPDAQDIQLIPHSTNSGHGQIYFRGNASNESSSIKLNHYGHADYVIGSGRHSNGMFSITRSDTGTDGLLMNSSGKIKIGGAPETLTGNGFNAKLQVNNVSNDYDGIMIGGGYNRSTINTGANYDLVLTSNAYPANATSKGIRFLCGSNGGGGPNERMRIYSEGYVTKPAQPRFMAYRGSSSITSVSSGTITGWNNVKYNIGNGFSNGTKFTAPVTGTYMFGVNIRWGCSGQVRVVRVQLDHLNSSGGGKGNYGGGVGGTEDHDGGSGYDHPYTSFTNLVEMDAGDYVQVTLQEVAYSGQLDIQAQGFTTNFWGCLMF